MSSNSVSQHSTNRSANLVEVGKTRRGNAQSGSQVNSLLDIPTKFEQTIAATGISLPGSDSLFQGELEKMMQRADELRTAAPNETPLETIKRLFELRELEKQIEQKVVEVLENHTVENDDNQALNEQELNNLSTQPGLINQDLALAAQYVLDNPEMHSTLDGAATGEVNGEISLSDFHQHQLAYSTDIKNQLEADDTPGDYTVPDETDPNIYNDEPNRDPELYSSQQDAVEAAIRTGEPTQYTNSAGEVITVTITSVPGADTPTYQVSLGDGTQFKVESELGVSETIEAIANVLEWGSTSGVADGIRRYPDNVRFVQQTHPNGWAASYYTTFDHTGPNHTMTFYNGTYAIDQGTYYHEIGHGIGTDLAETRLQLVLVDGKPAIIPVKDTGIPEGWGDVMDEAEANGIGSVSAYPGTYENEVDRQEEDFSEAYAGYMQAKDHGPEALEAFRQAYPYRSAFIEQHVLA